MAKFDVFLSHNSIDKPWVIYLKDALIQYGLSVWLDKDEIRPGDHFAKALEDGLENSQAVALVVSPESMASGWVEEEYYRALSLSKDKKINLQLIPVILRSAPLPGFVQSRNHVSFEDSTSYAENVWKLVWGITGTKPKKILGITYLEDRKQPLRKAPLYNVPKLPPHFINRSEHIDKIKRLLRQDLGRNVGITGISQSVGLQGMGGIGKSILATAIAYDEEIRDTFYDGIIWVTVGQNPDIVGLQSIILEYLDQSGIIPENPEHGMRILSNYLRDKKFLLVLDDVWKINDVHYFDISSIESKTLITTRHSQILRGVSADEYKIDVLAPEQAMLLLRIQSKWEETEMPEEAELIVKECGALPLAISMIGAMLKNKPLNRWQQALKHLRNAELRNIRQQFSNYVYPDLFVALHVSVAAQPATIQNLYLTLAVFPQDIPIPESVLDVYWDKDDLQHYDVLEIIDELLDASLIFRYDEKNLTLHDLQNDYVRSQYPDVQALHNKIINGYKKAFPLGWHAIPYENPWYFHRKIFYHLEQTGDPEKVKTVVEQMLTQKNFLYWKDILTYGKLTNKKPEQLALQVIKTSHLSSTLIQCLKLLRDERKDEARRLLNLEEQNPIVIAVSLKMLGAEAKDEARRLLNLDNQHPHVIAACLNLLGAEAKNEARRLLNLDNQQPHVIAACLNLLGAEAKNEARRLLKLDNQHPHVIAACLNLLGAEAKNEARRLLKLDNQHPHVIAACLNRLGTEAKDEARRLLKLDNQHPHVIAACLNRLGTEAKDEAQRLLKLDNQHYQVTIACLNLLGAEAKDEARRLLKPDNQHPHVITACLNLLRAEAKNEARRLLKLDNQHPDVITACLNLLGTEAKDEARRLLKLNNQYPDVVAACLNLLGAEAKDEARRLLKLDNQYPDVIAACLNLLGAEAKNEARRLLKLDNQQPHVIAACLNLLGAEAKDEARRLLKLDNQYPDVIAACLNLLGAEAKDEARRLLKLDNQQPHVITACLNLLGAEAKDEARRLLKLDNQHYQVTIACLNLLGAEAKDEARRLLKLDNQHPHVIAACLNRLGAEARDEARRLLKLDNQHLDVTIACLGILDVDAVEFVRDKLRSNEWERIDARIKMKILTIPIKEDVREKRALDILSKWKTYDRRLVAASLRVFDEDPQRVSNVCTEIMQNWDQDFRYYEEKRIPKYSGHIRKAMYHPELLHLSRLLVMEIIKKEEEKPGFVDEELLEFVQLVIEGTIFDWTDPI